MFEEVNEDDVVCEIWHTLKPNETCPVCKHQWCSHCLGDPMQMFQERICPHCLLTMEENELEVREH